MRSRNILAESCNILTLEDGEFIHLTGTSFILYSLFLAKKRISTSKANLFILEPLKSFFAILFGNNLNPHWVSFIPSSKSIFTKRLNSRPIFCLYHGCLFTISDSLSPLDPITTLYPSQSQKNNFSTSSMGVDKSASDMRMRR